MKRLLILLAAIVLLVVLGLVVFLSTFDADRYRPLLVQQLTRALGTPVRLERLSLGWQGGVAVRLHGLTVEDPASSEPLLQLDDTSAVARLLPLLRKEVQITAVLLTHPRIHVARDAQGRVNLLGLVPPPVGSGPLVAVAHSPEPSAPSRGGVGTHAAPVTFQISHIRIAQGSLHWTDALSPALPELWLRALDVTVTEFAPGKPMTVAIQAALAGEPFDSASGLAQGESRAKSRDERPNLQVRGRVTLPGPGREGAVEQLTVQLDAVPLEQLRPLRPDEPHVRGRLTLRLQGGTHTLDPARVAQALSGSGTLRVAEPVLVHLNLLREVFARLSMLPGLMETLQARLPAEYQAKFSSPDTRFDPIELSVALADGAFRLQPTTLGTDVFHLVAGGSVGLDGALRLNGLLRIEPAFSSALIISVHELRLLTNPQGELEIPLLLSGSLPRVAVAPDLNYVASKLVATKIEDLLGAVLHKALEKHLAPDSAATEP